MNLDSLAKPFGDGASTRFLVVSYLPTLAGASFLLILVWAGAPGPRPQWRNAWQTAASLNLGQIVGLGLALTIVAVLTMPLQLSLVRLIEGYWRPILVPLDRLLRAAQRKRRQRLAGRTVLPAADAEPDAEPDADPDTKPDAEPDAAQIRAAGLAGTQLKQQFPPEDRVLPTALGNALAAMEHRAGAGYGWDAVVAWPRLYPVLPDRIRAAVDERRNSLDMSARFVVTGAITALAALALLMRSGWWLALALLPLLVCRLAYVAAIQAAIAYGEAVEAAFDLGRFELLRALHLPMPADAAAERVLAQRLCLQWRQGVHADLTYDH